MYLFKVNGPLIFHCWNVFELHFILDNFLCLICSQIGTNNGMIVCGSSQETCKIKMCFKGHLDYLHCIVARNSANQVMPPLFVGHQNFFLQISCNYINLDALLAVMCVSMSRYHLKAISYFTRCSYMHHLRIILWMYQEFSTHISWITYVTEFQGSM